jgi:hypothetical protein
MRDYEESPLRMMDDFDVLDDDPNEGRFDIDESSSLNLKFRFKNNPLGFV